jgi:hypothetical protein
MTRASGSTIQYSGRTPRGRRDAHLTHPEPPEVGVEPQRQLYRRGPAMPVPSPPRRRHSNSASIARDLHQHLTVSVIGKLASCGAIVALRGPSYTSTVVAYDVTHTDT